ncbi:MAG: rRNA maturation RNase YbeY [Chloroflexi bacterium]|nr:rRNA maturation RNase YbeY [Chloroflexota bacterium]
MEISVLIESEFKRRLEVNWLISIAEQILVAQGISHDAELSVVITTREGIRELNRDYRRKDEPTDVLAFAMMPVEEGKEGASFVTPPDGMLHLGEVIISYPQAAAQAEERRHSVKREIAILLIHGVLHLLGYEHDKPELERKMRAKESEILSRIEENTPLD